MQEEWRPIEGWPYEVSSLGRVRRSRHWTSTYVGRALKPKRTPDGYLVVTLQNRPRSATMSVNKLVAVAFLGPQPSELHQASHRSPDFSDNAVSNLEWRLPKEVAAARTARGNTARGSASPRSKLTRRKVIALRRRRKATGLSYQALGDEFGVTPRAAWLVCTGGSWSHVREGLPRNPAPTSVTAP